MNIYITVVVALGCLSSIALSEKEVDVQLPDDKIHSAAQSCINFGMGFVGQCSPQYGDSLCTQLFCAEPKTYGYKEVGLNGMTPDGTICGQSKICQKGVCKGVPKSRIPRDLGSKVVKTCFKSVEGKNEPDHKSKTFISLLLKLNV